MARPLRPDDMGETRMMTLRPEIAPYGQHARREQQTDERPDDIGGPPFLCQYVRDWLLPRKLDLIVGLANRFVPRWP